MPLASLFNLQWNGPASSAAVITAPATIDSGIEGYARANGSAAGSAAVTNADATRLRSRPATLTGSASVTNALPKGRARPTALISIGSRPTADDIAQAVWGSPQTITLEAGTMARAMRLTAAIAANRVITDPVAGTYTVYDDDNTTGICGRTPQAPPPTPVPVLNAGTV